MEYLLIGLAVIAIVWAIWYTHKHMDVSNYRQGNGKDFYKDDHE